MYCVCLHVYLFTIIGNKQSTCSYLLWGCQEFRAMAKILHGRIEVPNDPVLLMWVQMKEFRSFTTLHVWNTCCMVLMKQNKYTRQLIKCRDKICTSYQKCFIFLFFVIYLILNFIYLINENSRQPMAPRGFLQYNNGFKFPL